MLKTAARMLLLTGGIKTPGPARTPSSGGKYNTRRRLKERTYLVEYRTNLTILHP